MTVISTHTDQMKPELKSLFLTLVVLMVFNVGNHLRAQCGDSIDLGTWIVEGNAANGNWSVTNGGNNVNQSINGNPTFYVSPDSFINVIITGDIQVATTGDNDWVGFVFGYIDPDSNTTNNFDFYLFDWKQENQVFGGYLGSEGYSLSKVDGPITNFPQAFSSKAGPYVTPLATNYGNTLGWNDLQTYSFALTYTNTRTVISIDGDTIFDIFGCFPPGRFGFYNYSQSNVNYSNFSYRVAAAFEVLTPNVCLGDTAYFLALSDSCENAAGIPVNNTLVGWYWDFGDGNTSTDTNGKHLYTNAGVYDVFLVVTDYLGCTDTAYSTVEIYNIGTSLPNDTSICIGDSIVLDADTLGTSYLWTNGATTQTQTIGDSGWYGVTVSNIPGCVDSDSVHISLTTLPVVDLGPDTSRCNADTIVLNAGNAGATFLWNTGSVFDTVAVVDSGVYSVTVTYPSGCGNSDTVVITNYAQPVVTPPNPTLCFGDTISITATGANSYTWAPSFGLSSATGTVVDIFTTVDTTYSVIGTDSNGCTDTSIFFVDVYGLPSGSFAAHDDSICLGDSTLLKINFTGDAPWSIRYTLNEVDTFTRTGITIPVDSFYVADSGMYRLIEVANGNCSIDGLLDSAYLFLDSIPVIQILSASDSLCTGDTLSMQANGAQNYTWFPAAGLTNTNNATTGALPTTNTTYFAIGTDANGCVDTGSIGLSVLALPNINLIATPNQICLNDSVVLECAGASSYVWEQLAAGTIFTGDSIIDTPQVTTSYLLTGTDSFGCVDTVSIPVQVDTLPIIVITPSDTVFCKFDTGSISVAGAITYEWSLQFGLSGTAGVSNQVFPIDTSTYTIVGTDGNGCVGENDFTVNIWELPPVLISALNSPICFSDTDTLVATGAVSYTWISTYNIDSIAMDSVSVVPDSSVNYIVQGTDGNGCIQNDTFEVVVDTLPIVEITTPDDTICKLDTTQLIASNALNYSWDNLNGLNPYSGSMVDAFPKNTRTFSVEGTDANGCKDSASILIFVTPLPTILTHPNPANMCVGETKKVSLPTIYNYQWSPTTNLNLLNANGDTAIASDLDTTIYTVTGTDTFGCVNDTSFQLSVTPLPILTIEASDSVICSGTDDTISVSGAIYYEWSPNVAINSTVSSNPRMSPTETTKYYVVGTGPGGCESTDSITIFVYDIAPFSGGSDTEICSRDTIQLDAYGGDGYKWFPNSDISDPNIPDPLCYPSTSRYYTVAITDSNGCVNQSTIFIEVNPLPKARAGVRDTICKGDTSTLGASPPGPLGATYDWSPKHSLLDTNITPRPFAQPDTTTRYTLVITDTNGCQDEDGMLVIVQELPFMEIVERYDYICLEDTLSFSVTPGLDAYDWSPATGVFSPNKARSLLSLPVSDSIEITGADSNGCETSVNIWVEVKSLPLVQIPPLGPYCEGDSFLLDPIVSEGEYTWSPVGVVDDYQSAQTTAFPKSPTDLRLRVVDEFGCSKRDDLFVVVHPMPYADAGEDISNCKMRRVYLGGEVTAGFDDSVSWWPPENLSDPYAHRPGVLSTTNETFYLTVTSPEGCQNFDTIAVDNDCLTLLYAPNAFSPDQDGINEEFKLYGHRVFDFHLVIYDKWGHTVFETSDLDKGWDGTFERRGKPSPIDSYFWQCTYRTEPGRQLSQEGVVTLIR